MSKDPDKTPPGFPEFHPDDKDQVRPLRRAPAPDPRTPAELAAIREAMDADFSMIEPRAAYQPPPDDPREPVTSADLKIDPAVLAQIRAEGGPAPMLPSTEYVKAKVGEAVTNMEALAVARENSIWHLSERQLAAVVVVAGGLTAVFDLMDADVRDPFKLLAAFGKAAVASAIVYVGGRSGVRK